MRTAYNKARDMGEIDYKEITLFENYSNFLKNAIAFDLHLWKIAELHVEHDGLICSQRKSYVERLSHELIIRYNQGINDDQIWNACQVVANEFF